MKALSEKDGSEKHINALLYHMGACKQPGVPLLTTLHGEAAPLLDHLITKERSIQDAKRDLILKTAEADFTEISLEDTVRDLHAESGTQDRKDPTLGSQIKMFPHGFGPIIDEENENQFAPLITLRTNLEPFLVIPSFAVIAATLTEQEERLRERLKAKKAAADLVATLEAEEKISRTKIREQLQSAYGRLRDLYKSNPKRAERFFERARKSKPRSR